MESHPHPSNNARTTVVGMRFLISHVGESMGTVWVEKPIDD